LPSFLIQRDLINKTGKQIFIRLGETYQYLYFMANEEDAGELIKAYPEISKESMATVERASTVRTDHFCGRNIQIASPLFGRGFTVTGL
jgi:hypothetical protein